MKKILGFSSLLVLTLLFVNGRITASAASIKSEKAQWSGKCVQSEVCTKEAGRCVAVTTPSAVQSSDAEMVVETGMPDQKAADTKQFAGNSVTDAEQEKEGRHVDGLCECAEAFTTKAEPENDPEMQETPGIRNWTTEGTFSGEKEMRTDRDVSVTAEPVYTFVGEATDTDSLTVEKKVLESMEQSAEETSDENIFEGNLPENIEILETPEIPVSERVVVTLGAIDVTSEKADLADDAEEAFETDVAESEERTYQMDRVSQESQIPTNVTGTRVCVHALDDTSEDSGSDSLALQKMILSARGSLLAIGICVLSVMEHKNRP